MLLRPHLAYPAATPAAPAHPMAQPLERALARLSHDMALLRDSATQDKPQSKLARLFARFTQKRLSGQLDPEQNTLTYVLKSASFQAQESYWTAATIAKEELKNTVGAKVYGESFIEARLSPRAERIYEERLRRCAQRHNGEKTQSVLNNLRDVPAWQSLQAACADAANNVRIELVVESRIGAKDDILAAGGGYTWDSREGHALVDYKVSARVYLNEPYSASTAKPAARAAAPKAG